jgi:Cytochrome oxidase assembly protein
MRSRWRAEGSAPRQPILLLASIPLLGTLAQAVLGGITVLTGLHPLIVGAHLLLSVAIIGGCVVLVHRAGEPGDEPLVRLVRPEIRALSLVLVTTCAVVVVLGTLVTGAGPHSGDTDVEHRLDIDVRTLAWLHADVVLLFRRPRESPMVVPRLPGGGDRAGHRGLHAMVRRRAVGPGRDPHAPCLPRLGRHPQDPPEPAYPRLRRTRSVGAGVRQGTVRQGTVRQGTGAGPVGSALGTAGSEVPGVANTEP